MYRGTTPTITINCDIDVSEFVTMWVTFRTQQLATYAPPKQVEVTKHLGDEGVDATDKVVTVSLTQADTLLLGITDDRHHTHKQAQAAKVWTIAHNLGKRPAVTVVDSAGTVVIGEVDYLDDNTVRLTFCAAFSGTAYFN